MIIQCIIIDDEPLARKGLKEYIDDIDFLHLVGECDSPLKVSTLLQAEAVQLIFLDIQMPRLTGIEFIKTVRNAPPVIFTTAYPNYALEGFELNALDYLVKPISFERFMKAALKEAREYYGVREKNLADSKEDIDYFFIKSENKLVRILLEDILYVEGLQNYVCIHTKEKKHITYLTFKAVEAYLPTDKFIKVHKSYILAASKITSIEGNTLQIAGHSLPISRGLREEVLEKLLKGKFLKR